ncbi:AraC family transcriptional regulator [Methylicorpusculum sp.]|uniref:helix-turn-helix transcriptional regulator n=1 Tax=Methylicorpusculum sp. TaxID=2713644 RepID=UPI002ABBB2FD|nr:AraC family transcriptional regulator [Methylicorpusculum sp.]MDZ4152140.1 AraC family transcriptional regulator [Methylicorpusculum sp.]
MDALTPLINGLNLHAKLVYSGGVCGRWRMDHNSETSVWFHLISKGQGFVHSPNWQTPLVLNKGDLVLFLPHAARHFLSYSAEHLPDTDKDTRMTPWKEGEAGFVCGEIELATPKSLLWQALPGEIVIRQNQPVNSLARLIELIIGEASGQRFGSDSVIERLCDSLFVLVIRYCIEEGLVRKGLFAAMQDKRLAMALGLIHQQPWHAWTLNELCTRAGVSKSVLSEKFTTLIGHSPIKYLTVWRLQIAAHWLMQPAMSVERVAERCGYESVPAFSKAFKRHFGVAPGSFRRV